LLGLDLTVPPVREREDTYLHTRVLPT
jgi:hypothetical protein